MIKSLDVPLTLLSAYQTTVNSLITKQKYFDSHERKQPLNDNLTLNNSRLQLIYVQQKWVGIEYI